MPTFKPLTIGEPHQTPTSDPVTLSVTAETVRTIRDIARRFGWQLDGSRRATLIPQMVEHYGSTTSAEQALARLGEKERRLLALIAFANWSPRAALLDQLRALVRLLPKGWIDLPTQKQINHLMEQGYVLQASLEGNTVRLGVGPGFIPPLLPLPGLPERAREGKDRLDRLPLVDPFQAIIASWEIARGRAPLELLPAFEPGTVTRGPEAWPVAVGEQNMTPWASTKPMRVPIVHSAFAPSVIQEVSRAIGTGDQEAARFYLALLYWMNLLTYGVGSKTLEADSDAFQTFLSLSPTDQLERMIQHWLILPYGLWDEYSTTQRDDPDLRLFRSGQSWSFTPSLLSAGFTSARRFTLTMLDWLKQAEEGEGWVDVPALASLVASTFPTTISPDGQSSWFLGNASGTAYQTAQPRDWHRAHEKVWHTMIRGPLRWLGLVDCATVGGRLRALRLTPLAEAWRTGRPLPSPESEPPAWDETLAIRFRPGPGTSRLFALLQKVAEDVGFQEGYLHYRFTVEAAHRAFQQGQLPTELRHAFAEAGTPLPAAVSSALDRWWESWGRAHWYHDLALIEVADELLMQELLRTTSLGQHILFRCSATVLAIDPTAVDALAAELQARSHTPKVVDR